MKRETIRAEVGKTLTALGFKKGQYKWSGCSVDIVLGQQFKTLSFPAGMSKRALAWEFGRLTGWIEVLSDNYSAQNPERRLKSQSRPQKRVQKMKPTPLEVAIEAAA